jgi:hypothetical protein
MRVTNLSSRLLSSKIFRFSLEIIVSLVLFSWLSVPVQIMATIVVSLVVESASSKIMKDNFQKEFATKNWSEILESYKTERG